MRSDAVTAEKNKKIKSLPLICEKEVFCIGTVFTVPFLFFIRSVFSERIHDIERNVSLRFPAEIEITAENAPCRKRAVEMGHEKPCQKGNRRVFREISLFHPLYQDRR